MQINYFDFSLKIRLIHIAFVTSIFTLYHPISTKFQGLYFSLEAIVFMSFLTPLAGLLSFCFKKFNPFLNYYIILILSSLYIPNTFLFIIDYVSPSYYVICVAALDFAIILFGTNFGIDLNAKITQKYSANVFKNFLRFNVVVTNAAIILISLFMICIQIITDNYKNILIILIFFEFILFVFDIVFRNKILKIFNN